MNSFQKWAINYAKSFGFTVLTRANWVTLSRDGDTQECMTVDCVQRACD